ncbi:MAG: hypothetical protein HKN33_07070 [Pyrinomonadaceae bacterium]|nr:hypothetical protein [Pyrinomonadaceae bacterium]
MKNSDDIVTQFKMVLTSLELSSFVSIFLGILLGIWGIISLFMPFQRFFGLGIGTLGAATILLGLTNGFSNPTPLGRIMFKIAVLLFPLGALMLVYYYRHSLMGIL